MSIFNYIKKCTNVVRQREDFSSGCSSEFRLGRFLLAWLLIGLFSSLAYAVPNTTNYQGYLENSETEPLNATVNMTFALYDAVEGGNVLWTEAHQGVVVTNGVFSLILGSGTPFNDESLAGERYLGIAVGGDPEMTPRQKLTSAFFAMRAGVAETVSAEAINSESIAAGAVTAEKIAAASVTADKIADGVTITDAERVKLEGLGTGGVGSNPTFDNVVVEEQLNVKKRIKVGENSLYLDGSGGTTAPANHIYASGGAPLLLQAAPSSGGDGNVGIGTTTPEYGLDIGIGMEVTKSGGASSKAQSLRVGAGHIITNHKNGALVLNSGPDGTGEGYSGIWFRKANVRGDIASSTNLARITSDGNVGIGIDDPKAKLDVEGVLKMSPILESEVKFLMNKFGKGIWAFYNETANEGEISSVNLFYPRSYSPLIINGKDVIINQQLPPGNLQPGNVGIGVTVVDPKYKLQVGGKTRINEQFVVRGAVKSDLTDFVNEAANVPTGSTLLWLKYVNANQPDNPMLIQASGHGDWTVADRFVVRTNGEVGIGTRNMDAGVALQIIHKNEDANGKNLVLGPTHSSNLRLGYHSNYSWIQSHGSKPLAINPIGNNVGIGTTTPSCKLDVRSGNICQNGIPIKSFFSDKRWKKDIEPLENSLEKVSSLQGVNYKWDIEKYPEMGFDDKPQIGLIAQEVEQVIPELVMTNNEGYKGVSYGNMTAVLVEAVKELKSQNDALKTIVCKDHPEEAICQ